MNHQIIPQIHPFNYIEPKIYGYIHPNYPAHQGLIKIGYTEGDIDKRIKEQNQTANIDWLKVFEKKAIFADGRAFKDHDFHAFLESKGVLRQKKTEWFKLDLPELEKYFEAFYNQQSSAQMRYFLRNEQEEAVSKTKEYFEKQGRNAEADFLWNAKPRFGKSLAAYHLVREMGFKKVLIVTNRPSIANSWLDDFNKFISWQKDLDFIAESDELKGKIGVFSREDWLKKDKRAGGFIAFTSLQNLKGSIHFGGNYNKLEWMSKLEFDLLIVDESHEGVSTHKTEKAFENIKRAYTLYLSGTPFKQLASGEFKEEQIYNWSYVDEQEVKAKYADEGVSSPYDVLPKLEMFTYQLGPMVRKTLEQGMQLDDDGEKVDFCFDLAEFFKVNSSGKFEHEEEVRKFLDCLTSNEKYPFSTPELREELKHTMWLLNRKNSVNALEKLLKEHPVFKDYEIIKAIGKTSSKAENEQSLEDGLGDDSDNRKSLDKVREAIKNNDKTITLSVGQLTTGVTIPEWTAVLMLCNLKSASSYMQAAFRAQNSYKEERGDKTYRKETAYVFDFDPTRTLEMYDEFASNLSVRVGKAVDEKQKQENVKKLLNFFPVIGEDEQGKMVELDAKRVLTIPRKIKSDEVVKCGFISNFLFANIHNVFGAPRAVQDILQKLEKTKEVKTSLNEANLNHQVDENGKAVIPKEVLIGKEKEIFTDKKIIVEVNSEEDVKSAKDGIECFTENTIIKRVKEKYNLNDKESKKIKEATAKEIESNFEKINDEKEREIKLLEIKRDNQEITEQEFKNERQNVEKNSYQQIQDFCRNYIEEKPQQLIKEQEEKKAQKKVNKASESAREHLRGFARTIPSFLMAYGHRDVRLGNFDQIVPEEVFKEVSNITLEEFRLLRDGGEYEEDGQTKYFAGKLFNETVFNDSIQAFLDKKEELADYFNEEQTEDIFDYIPPQRNNQIFTPKAVVIEMVDMLEKENPQCFDDPNHTFADLYMKSGMYIAEIVKRLYRSEGMKRAFPDERKRLEHIFTKQVYGMAPTKIIFNIAINYILGFNEEIRESVLKDGLGNFVCEDASIAAQEGRLQEVVNKHFGE